MNKPEEQPTAPNLASKNSKDNYWYGYFYAVVWAYISFCCATHSLAFIEAAKTQFNFLWAIIWAVFTVSFAWVTYCLLVRKVNMTIIYVLVGIHGYNVLARGIVPVELAIFISFSYIVIVKFRKRFARS